MNDGETPAPEKVFVVYEAFAVSRSNFSDKVGETIASHSRVIFWQTGFDIITDDGV